MVYEKSTRGLNEFANNQRTLSVRERQVLLLVNGVRNLDDLNKFFKQDQLLDTIKKLESEGYIQRPQEQKTILAATHTPPVTITLLETTDQAAPICPTKLASVKSILIEATDDYLGMMGRSIKTKIENCENETSLRQCISSWHMAMRESKLGRESASFLMEQIHQTLEGNIIDATSSAQPQH
ncbi:hypothetical protein [Methylotenera mobilis]|uniref:Uncharacterized protein n=1 Tax=Methylotenera mobilis (strain JLW8 / ATCC BAA-1282 / DSM 17540) TaxID=583345 RepID=C6WWL9_METML|nr:hypothetical protein [Methylotenera mobilis]ACT48318.1 hypothetical protein Mmol_1412 [Methylotenera mobilis JLW8]